MGTRSKSSLNPLISLSRADAVKHAEPTRLTAVRRQVSLSLSRPADTPGIIIISAVRRRQFRSGAGNDFSSLHSRILSLFPPVIRVLSRTSHTRLRRLVTDAAAALFALPYPPPPPIRYLRSASRSCPGHFSLFLRGKRSGG